MRRGSATSKAWWESHGRSDPSSAIATAVPKLDPDRVTERLSGNSNFLSISYTIVAESSEQIVALVNDLKATEGVLTIL
jgi:putative lipoic acid-binding regulatory protein